VELFIKGIINFKDIVSFIKYALESWKEFKEIENLEQIEYIKNWIKNLIKQKVGYNL